jgi:hypothetical protein
MLICDTDNVMSRLFRKSLTAGKIREWIMPFRLLTLKSSKEMAITTIWCYATSIIKFYLFNYFWLSLTQSILFTAIKIIMLTCEGHGVFL